MGRARGDECVAPRSHVGPPISSALFAEARCWGNTEESGPPPPTAADRRRPRPQVYEPERSYIKHAARRRTVSARPPARWALFARAWDTFHSASARCTTAAHLVILPRHAYYGCWTAPSGRPAASRVPGTPRPPEAGAFRRGSGRYNQPLGHPACTLRAPCVPPPPPPPHPRAARCHAVPPAPTRHRTPHRSRTAAVAVHSNGPARRCSASPLWAAGRQLLSWHSAAAIAAAGSGGSRQQDVPAPSSDGLCSTQLRRAPLQR